MENLYYNEYLQAILSHISEVKTKAAKEGWVVCVPRTGSIPPPHKRTINALKAHVLVPIENQKNPNMKVFRSLLSQNEINQQGRHIEYVLDVEESLFTLRLSSREYKNYDNDSNSSDSEEEEEDNEGESMSTSLLMHLKSMQLEDSSVTLKQKLRLPPIKNLYQGQVDIASDYNENSIFVMLMNRSFFGNEVVPFLPNGKELFIDERTTKEWNEVFALDGSLSLDVVHLFDKKIVEFSDLVPETYEDQAQYQTLRKKLLSRLEKEKDIAIKDLVARNGNRFGCVVSNLHFREILLSYFGTRAMEILFPRIFSFICNMCSSQEENFQKNLLAIDLLLHKKIDIQKLNISKKHYNFVIKQQIIYDIQHLSDYRSPLAKLKCLGKIINSLENSSHFINPSSSASSEVISAQSKENNSSDDIVSLFIILIARSKLTDVFANFYFMKDWAISSSKDFNNSLSMTSLRETTSYNRELQSFETAISLIYKYEEHEIAKSKEMSAPEKVANEKSLQKDNNSSKIQNQNNLSSLMNFIKEAWSD